MKNGAKGVALIIPVSGDATKEVAQGMVKGVVKGIQNPLGLPYKSRFVFNTELNDQIYCVESPDGIEPVGTGAYSVFRYAENNISAGVAFQGDYKTVILGFPVETLDTQEQVDCLIGEVARFFKR